MDTIRTFRVHEVHKVKTRQEIESHYPAPIHQTTGMDGMHCVWCFLEGESIPNHYALIRWKGSEIEWLHTFPCLLSQREFLEDVSQDAEVLEQGDIRNGTA